MSQLLLLLSPFKPDVDVERAKSVGLPDGESAESYNSSAIEVLRQLPGITSYNWKKVIKGVTNLSELAGMSEV